MEKARRTYEALLSLAKKWAIYVAVRPMPGPLKGKIRGLHVHSDTDKILPGVQDLIWIEEDLTLEEKTYVLAHELGHYLYQLEHGDLPKYYWAYDKELYAKVEAEVNELAQGLLSHVEEDILATPGHTPRQVWVGWTRGPGVPDRVDRGLDNCPRVRTRKVTA
ncbi:MAG: ImmA/IrrE family metallo-endopeptidase [Bacillota bacterium]